MTLDLVKEYLYSEGYRPKIDDDGDLAFTAEGLHFCYFANTNDQEFFQLALPGVLDADNHDREKVLDACNAVNMKMKVAKACIVPNQNSVWIFFENILDTDPKIDDIVPRAINTLIGAFRAFREKMAE